MDIVPNSTDALLHGYEVMVLCCGVILGCSILMCWLTWQFRYKIVLRSRDHTETILVHKLVYELREEEQLDAGLEHLEIQAEVAPPVRKPRRSSDVGLLHLQHTRNNSGIVYENSSANHSTVYRSRDLYENSQHTSANALHNIVENTPNIT